VIIVMGVAGSGKSSQGKLLADEMGYPWLSTGEFLRMIVAGERRKGMLAGKLLEDHEMIDVMKKVFTMIDVTNEFVLDGFPRTVVQADWILEYAKQHGIPNIAVVHIVASKETVKQRLLDRGRKDDHDDAISERFDEYERAIKPILQHFKDSGSTVVDVDGERDIEAVHDDIKRVIKGA